MIVSHISLHAHLKLGWKDAQNHDQTCDSTNLKELRKFGPKCQKHMGSYYKNQTVLNQPQSIGLCDQGYWDLNLQLWAVYPSALQAGCCSCSRCVGSNWTCRDHKHQRSPCEETEALFGADIGLLQNRGFPPKICWPHQHTPKPPWFNLQGEAASGAEASGAFFCSLRSVMKIFVLIHL